jgi:TRAP-type C4-dicarboxylate transport system permease small subunit
MGISRIPQYLSKGLLWVACVTVFAMCLQITADVLLRKFINQPIAGTLEICSNYYMVLVSFLPLAYLQSKKEHLIVESFTTWLPKPFVTALDRVVLAFCLVFFAFYIWATIEEALDRTSTLSIVETPTFDIHIWPSFWMLPISLMALWIVTFSQLFEKQGDPAVGAHNNV